MANISPNQEEIKKKKDQNKKLLELYASEIIDEYKKHEVFTIVQDKYHDISSGVLRKFLKEKGIYNPRSLNSKKHRAKRIQDSLIERHGIINPSQLHNNREKLKEWNLIEKTKLEFMEDFKEYRSKVEWQTHKNEKFIVPSKYCYYTGIMFADNFLPKVNPNDYLKKSIDHKISVLYGFLNGIDPEIIGDVTNLVYCIKYCNTIKNNANCDDESFRLICKRLRERLIDEGYQHTQD